MKKTSRKLNGLTRVSCLMDTDKRGSVMKAFTSSHFSCSPQHRSFMIGVFITKLIECVNDHLELCMVIISTVLRSCFGKISLENYIIKTCKFLPQKSAKVKHGLSPQIINNVFQLKSVPYIMKRQDR